MNAVEHMGDQCYYLQKFKWNPHVALFIVVTEEYETATAYCWFVRIEHSMNRLLLFGEIYIHICDTGCFIQKDIFQNGKLGCWDPKLAQ